MPTSDLHSKQFTPQFIDCQFVMHQQKAHKALTRKKKEGKENKKKIQFHKCHDHTRDIFNSFFFFLVNYIFSSFNRLVLCVGHIEGRGLNILISKPQNFMVFQMNLFVCLNQFLVRSRQNWKQYQIMQRWGSSAKFCGR